MPSADRAVRPAPFPASRRGAAAALRHRQRRWLPALFWLLVTVAVLVAAWWWYSRPDTPDAFYAAPAELPARPGALLRSEPFSRGVPAGARGWRILYTTTREEGTPAVASALVIVPDAVTGVPNHASTNAPASAPRPVVAWAHGTTGVAPGCAPSLLEQPFAHVPAFEPALREGWAIVATDYAGLGTEGPHPYLIGEGQARSALDAVRAARQLGEARLGAQTVVWGHSQGGHAALWTGLLAPAYAPDAGVIGVAAAAPASDLPALINRIADAPAGRVMTSYLLEAYSRTYPDVRFADYTRPLARPFARDMAGRCLAGRRALFSVAEAMLIGGPIFERTPTTGALGARLAQNVANAPIVAPLLLAQGGSDELVPAEAQRAYVARRCAAGQAIDYREYAGRDHLGVVAADSPFGDDLVAWTRARFAGAPAPASCPGVAAPG